MRWWTFYTISLYVSLLGLLIFVASRPLMEMFVANAFTISVSSQLYSTWVSPPVSIKNSMFLFHVANPLDIKKGAKPLLIERGPYVFWQHSSKHDVVFHANNFSVSYQQVQNYTFDPDLSQDNRLEDRITTLNPPAVLIVQQASTLNVPLGTLNTVMKLVGERLFVTRSAREILFDGYGDALLSMGKLSDSSTPDKWGYFYGRNNSLTSATYTVLTGEQDMAERGQIAKLDGKSFVGTNNEDNDCYKLHGGIEYFPALTTQLYSKESLYLFTEDLCRVLELELEKIDAVHGVDVKKYVIAPNLFANGSINAKNRCFEDDILPGGVHNLIKCTDGVPLFVSQPHFFQADPFHLQQLDDRSDLRPNKELHETSISVEPVTGLPLELYIRLQLNLHLKPSKQLSIVKNVPELIFPTVWFQSEFRLDEEQAPFLWAVANLDLLLQIIACAMFIVALAIFWKAVQRDADKAFTNVGDQTNRNQLELMESER